MGHRDWRKRIDDILCAIERISEHTRGMSPEAFANDRKTQDAVHFNLMVIGEAAGQIEPGVVASHPEIPWAEMRGMRNVLIHAYFSVSTEIVWRTLTDDLPPIVESLNKLLRSPA
jgi:uncharacterized protein with HEPN domain